MCEVGGVGGLRARGKKRRKGSRCDRGASVFSGRGRTGGCQ